MAVGRRREALGGLALVALMLSACNFSGATKVGNGGDGSCAIAGGKVSCWGSTFYGDGTTRLPSQVVGPTAAGITDAVQVTGGSAGSDYLHQCALLATGTVECWGDNRYGELGLGYHSTAQVRTPTAVPGIDDAVQLATGALYTCARHATGTVSCWGDDVSGQLGVAEEQDSPTPVIGITDAVDLATYAAGTDTCVVHATGGVSCWGDDTWGQLDNNDGVIVQFNPTPSTVYGLTDAVQVAVGHTDICALRTNHTVVCWGKGISKNTPVIGQGANQAPVAITGATDGVKLVVSGSAECLLTTTGGVVCWGTNVGGEVGDGTTTNRDAAVAVTGISGATDLAATAAGGTLCAVVANGEIRCWGYNLYRSLGTDITGAYTTTPVPVVRGAGS